MDKLNNNWKEVWHKKGLQTKDLHQMDGLDHMNKIQWDEFLSRSFQPVQELIKNYETVFELGCGAGAALRFLKEKNSNLKLFGFDYSESLIEVCNKNLEGEFWVDDAESQEWKFEDRKYDFVFNVGTFMYISSEEAAVKIVKKMLDLSKSGKIFLIEISDKEREHLAKDIRKSTHPTNNNLVKAELDHLYLSKEIFKKIADENNCSIQIFDQIDICNFDWNLSAPYRYNVLIEKK